MAASDRDKLVALCAVGQKLNAWEQVAFSSMLEQLDNRNNKKKLSTKQREIINQSYLRYELDADEPSENLVSTGKVAKSETVFPYELFPRPKRPPGKEEVKVEVAKPQPGLLGKE